MVTSKSIWNPTPETRVTTRDLAILRGGPAAACLPEHSHPELQVSVRFGPGNDADREGPVEVNLYAPRQGHVSEWNAGWRVIVWHLSGRLLEQAADELGSRGRFDVIPMSSGRDEMLEAAARMLAREFPPAPVSDSLYFESMAGFLAGYLLRRHCDVRVRSVSAHRLAEGEMRRLHRFIHERIETGFDVSSLAVWMGMNAQEFSERLRLTTGLAPWAYVQRYRIAMACELLKKDRLSLAEVAQQLGFANQSHFTNAFRARMRMTPGAYRKL